MRLQKFDQLRLCEFCIVFPFIVQMKDTKVDEDRLVNFLTASAFRIRLEGVNTFI